MLTKIRNVLLVLLIIALSILLFLEKKPLFPTETTQSTITPDTLILEAIHHVNKQIFIEHYNAVDVTYTEVPSGWAGLLGIQQEFVVLIRGRVPAGFDLANLSSNDIWVSQDNKRAQLTLPPPIIFEDNVSIDFENSYILAQRDSCPNFICQDDLVAYQNEVLPAGKDVLVEFALNNGILEQVVDDGVEYYSLLLKSLGFENVCVIVRGYSSSCP